MKIYLSGKMTGLPDYGRKHFNRTALALRKCGHPVLNPATLPTGLDKADYMPICLAMLNAADAIYMLRGWEHSPGATLEREFALYQGKHIFYEADADSYRELFDPTKEE